MAKSATSLLRTFPRPFGEVVPTMARPGAPSALITVAKSLAIRLALTSPGSARTVDSFATAGWATSGASASPERAAPPDAMPQYSFAIFIDRTAVRDHAIGDFLGLGGQVPACQKH